MKKITKRAVVLFNLGGPDRLAAVKPFLFNLFYDPAIISLPNPLRFLIAKLISSRREKEATLIYQDIGGGSPLLPNTQAQANALEEALRCKNEADRGALDKRAVLKKEKNHPLTQQREDRVFIAMRYWHPLTPETVRLVKKFDPDEIVLLPLYPHFSGTTTGSSYQEWTREAQKQGLEKPTRLICCYPTHEGVTKGYAQLLMPFLDKREQPFRILFSAHGLPESKVKAGDPYPVQVLETVKGVLSQLSLLRSSPSKTDVCAPDSSSPLVPHPCSQPQALDWVLCYQSRVGPVKWIGPDTETEIIRAAQEGLGVIVVPIAFVSEHSETLVELDIEYRNLAEKHSIPFYDRVPTLGLQGDFIQGLSALVNQGRSSYLCPEVCPWKKGLCA